MIWSKVMTTSYVVSSNKIPESFDGTKICFLTDLHNKCYGERNQELIHEINRQKPDYIMITGDMIVKGDCINTEVAVDLLEQLSKRYPIYFANGNHEKKVSEVTSSSYDLYCVFAHKLAAMGVTYLKNETVFIEKENQRIQVTGLDLPLTYYKKLKTAEMSVNELTAMIPKQGDEFQILLAHNPLYFDQYAKYGADLILSGHVHGGLFVLPFIGGIMSTQGHLFPKYDFGQFEQENSTMILSRGLGSHSIGIRINNPPEVVVVTLRKH